MSWWSSKVPLAFGQLVKLRDNLDGISKHFSKLNEFKSVESILFVEGKSEKTFLEGLKKSGYASFLYLKIIDYNGTGNSKVKRIHMMIDDYHKRGFKVFIQGDRDGKNKDVFTKLCSKCNIPKENTITFKHDFESSFPIDFLLTSLKTAGLLKNVNKDEIKDKIIKNDVSVVTLLKDNYGIDITDNKVLFTEIASELFFKFYRTWWNDDDFLESELGKFIHFVSKM